MTRGGNGQRHGVGSYRNELFALPDSVFVLLRDLIEERTGVLFDELKRGLLADKISELVTASGLSSILDYYYLLRYDEDAEAHWSALMNRLAVPETFFWRQSDQLLALANVLARAHFARDPARPLRIWSAGCCSGEEPVSMAIALAEAGLLGVYPIQITATDGSSALVERARLGLYGERSFRQLPATLRAKYFVPDGDLSRPVDFVRHGIRWDVANLAQPDDVRRFARADVIFCRNVFIYFSDAAIRGTVTAMSGEMPDDGTLFLGASESLSRLRTGFELVEIGSAFAYVKSGHAR